MKCLQDFSDNLHLYTKDVLTPMQCRVRRDRSVRGCSPNARSAVLQLLFDLLRTEWQKPVYCHLRFRARKAGDKLPDSAYGIRFRVSRCVLVRDFKHEIKE